MRNTALALALVSTHSVGVLAAGADDSKTAQVADDTGCEGSTYLLTRAGSRDRKWDEYPGENECARSRTGEL